MLEFCEELAVLFREDGFEFFSDVCGVGGAGSFGADGDLEAAAFDDGGDEEVAELGDVDDVAEYFELLAVLVDSLVEWAAAGGGDCEDGADEVVFGVGGFDELGGGIGAECGHHVTDSLGDDDEARACGQEGLRLSYGDGAATDYDHTATGQLEEYGVLCHGELL